MIRLLVYVEPGDTRELLWTSVHSNLVKLREVAETKEEDCENNVRRVLEMVLILERCDHSEITCQLCSKFLTSRD